MCTCYMYILLDIAIYFSAVMLTSCSVSYRGWGALGFPTLNFDSPVKFSKSTVYFVLFSHPSQWHQVLYLFVSETMILYILLSCIMLAIVFKSYA